MNAANDELVAALRQRAQEIQALAAPADMTTRQPQLPGINAQE